MNVVTDPHVISSVEQLRGVYDAPHQRSVLKQIDHIDQHALAFIAASPFLILSTSGNSGVDCSPRGDQPGFVRVSDNKTLLIPDRRGNNRLDSLKNILDRPAVALIFLVPGVNDTLRVNGRAQISLSPELLEQFVVSGKAPKAVLVVQVEEVFIQCPRALMRADLWNPAKFVPRGDLPSLGAVLEAHTGGCVNAASFDAEAATRIPETLY